MVRSCAGSPRLLVPVLIRKGCVCYQFKYRTLVILEQTQTTEHCPVERAAWLQARLTALLPALLRSRLLVARLRSRIATARHASPGTLRHSYHHDGSGAGGSGGGGGSHSVACTCTYLIVPCPHECMCTLHHGMYHRSNHPPWQRARIASHTSHTSHSVTRALTLTG